MVKSKNILITGASTGIGYDLVKVFVKSGYRVFGSVRKAEDGSRLLADFGEMFTPLLFDVTDHAAVDAAADEVAKVVGSEGLGGLINNAGVAVAGPLLEVSIEKYRYQFEVNVFGLIKVTQAFLPLLGARAAHEVAPGKVLQISSVAGKFGMPFMSPYAGSKHAVEGISDSLRRELLLYGIDVVVIEPGPIKTPIWKKSITANISDLPDGSPYALPLDIFQNVFVKRALKTAWTSEKAAAIILKAYEKPKSKTRYPIVAQRLINWDVPKWIPARWIDQVLGKKLKLIK